MVSGMLAEMEAGAGVDAAGAGCAKLTPALSATPAAAASTTAARRQLVRAWSILSFGEYMETSFYLPADYGHLLVSMLPQQITHRPDPVTEY
jgi:hypothetical protein